MRFAQWTFWLAGVYGLVVLTPMYGMEERIGIDSPPAITHPEHFYGFIGVALAWQFAFLIIGSDPGRYRPLMVPAIFEKGSFAAATIALYTKGRLAGMILGFGLIDLFLGFLFAIAFLRSKADESTAKLRL